MKHCHTNLFVFDETDKIPIGLMDTIKAYIDFYPEVDGITFRKSVFIFLRYVYLTIVTVIISLIIYNIWKYSNSAAKDIAKLTLSFDKQLIDRNDFDLKVFQSEIQNSIYHNKGLKRS